MTENTADPQSEYYVKDEWTKLFAYSFIQRQMEKNSFQTKW